MTIYKNLLSEICFMFGQFPNDLGDGMYLFCHSQFPNDYEKRIAIKIDGNRYYVFDYEKELDYENSDNKGSDAIGPAIIHNEELIIEDAKNFKKIALEMEENAPK